MHSIMKKISNLLVAIFLRAALLTPPFNYLKENGQMASPWPHGDAGFGVGGDSESGDGAFKAIHKIVAPLHWIIGAGGRRTSTEFFLYF